VTHRHTALTVSANEGVRWTETTVQNEWSGDTEYRPGARIYANAVCNRFPYPDLEVVELMGLKRMNEGGIVRKVSLGYDYDIVVHESGSKLDKHLCNTSVYSADSSSA
jgi:hypothetical protein